MKMTWLAACLLFLAAPALAEQQNSFVYSKTMIKILPRAGSQAPEPSAGGGKAVDPSNMMPTLLRAPKEFKVEVRTPAFLKQQDFIEHQPFADREGMLILVEPAAEATLTATRMIAKADVLFIDSDGNIIKIVPEIKLPTLSEPIESGKPIHAFLYLKSGTAASADIELGDRIESTYFKTHPVVIQ